MFKINGDDWRVVIVSPDHPMLQTSTGEFTLGACDREAGTIYISEGLDNAFMRKVICHEVAHAAMFSYDIFLDVAQEEILADLIASYGTEIVYITNKIFNRIKKSGNY